MTPVSQALTVAGGECTFSDHTSTLMVGTRLYMYKEHFKVITLYQSYRTRQTFLYYQTSTDFMFRQKMQHDG